MATPSRRQRTASGGGNASVENGNLILPLTMFGSFGKQINTWYQTWHAATQGTAQLTKGSRQRGRPRTQAAGGGGV